MCIPKLIEILDTRARQRSALSATISAQCWWTNPSKSPYYAHAEAMYNSSPKLKETVRYIRRLPEEDYVINAEAVANSKTGSRQSKWVDPILGKRKAKLVIFVNEAVLALCLLIVLTSGRVGEATRAIGETNVGVYRATGTGFNPKDRQELVTRFQDKPLNANSDRVEYGEPLGILIVLTKSGAQGITLTKASNEIMFDVDPSPSRATQVPKR